MTNEIRGERAVVIGGRRLDVALTMAALAELEAVFGTDFDQVSERLFRRETTAGGEAYPFPARRRSRASGARCSPPTAMIPASSTAPVSVRSPARSHARRLRLPAC